MPYIMDRGIGLDYCCLASTTANPAEAEREIHTAADLVRDQLQLELRWVPSAHVPHYRVLLEDRARVLDLIISRLGPVTDAMRQNELLEACMTQRLWRLFGPPAGAR